MFEDLIGYNLSIFDITPKDDQIDPVVNNGLQIEVSSSFDEDLNKHVIELFQLQDYRLYSDSFNILEINTRKYLRDSYVYQFYIALPISLIYTNDKNKTQLAIDFIPIIKLEHEITWHALNCLMYVDQYHSKIPDIDISYLDTIFLKIR